MNIIVKNSRNFFDSSITQVSPPSPDTIATICFSRLAAAGTKLLGR